MDYIPTKYKEKIGKDLSYPVTAKILSEALTDSPVFNELVANYHKEPGQRLGVFVPGWRLRYLKGASGDVLDCYEVLSCSYLTSTGWTIRVNAVKKEKKYSIARILKEIALPFLWSWLSETKQPSWYEGQRVLQIGIDSGCRKICFFETHNDRIVSKKRYSINDNIISV